MKKLLIAAAALSAFAIAAPASAQGYRHDSNRQNDYRRDSNRHNDYRRDDYRRDDYRYGGNINAEQARLEQRIRYGMRSGRLSEREAA